MKKTMMWLLVIVAIWMAAYQYTHAELMNEQAKELILSVIGR